MIQFILLSATLASAVLAGIVFINNPSKAINRVYFVLSLSAMVWLLSNALIIYGPLTPKADKLYLFFGRLITPSSIILAFSMLLFIAYFAYRSVFRYVKGFIFLALPGAIIVGLSFTNLNVSLAAHQTLQLGSLALPFTAVTVIYLLVAAYILFIELRRKRTINITQARYLQRAFLLSVVPATFLGTILPQFSNSSLSDFGPLFSIVFLFYAALLITRHGLFDVRPIVAKALAYLITLTVMATLYGFIVYNTAQFFLGKNSGISFEIYISVGTAAAALTFPYLKRYFDKATNRLFYKDAYDTQRFLDEFNRLLVSTYELSPILKKSAAIIEKYVRPTYTMYDLKKTNSAPRRLMGTATSQQIGEDGMTLVNKVTSNLRRKLVVTDLMEDRNSDLQRVLRANNIAILARLASSSSEEGIGYLVLGPKLSGNLYSKQDLKNIEIIANELVIAIQNALRFEEIKNFNLTLQAKVDVATRKLRKTNQRLEELDETKDDFISMASHQLRTPLTSVKGYLSMVLEGDAGKVNATQIKMLHQAFISSQRMVFLITDLLNVSRLKTGKFVIDSTPVDLSKLIQEEVSQLVETAQVKNIEITYNKPASFPLLMLDETKIRQVGMNFMDNAIYYTPVGGHINVELIDNPTTVELRVTDNGIGVPKSEQHHLFTKFYRATNARKTRPDGTGLGLFMAKKVIVAQGGSILFESKDGQGSTFGFVFSKAKLKVSESLVQTNGGTSLESPEPSDQKLKTKPLVPVK